MGKKSGVKRLLSKLLAFSVTLSLLMPAVGPAAGETHLSQSEVD